MIAGLYKPFQHWSENGAVWIYSDPHFSDPELPFFDADRPSDEEIVKNINSKVGKKDTLIILGDIGNIEYVRKLKGYKVLICGNHDIGASKYLRKVEKLKLASADYNREQAIEFAKAKYPGCGFHCHKVWDFIEPYEYWYLEVDNYLFDEVYEGPLVISEKIILSHEPIDLSYMFNIHGHVHSKTYKGDINHLNCVEEAIGYFPISLNQLMKNGVASKIDSIHRETIDEATRRKILKGKMGGKNNERA